MPTCLTGKMTEFSPTYTIQFTFKWPIRNNMHKSLWKNFLLCLIYDVPIVKQTGNASLRQIKGGKNGETKSKYHNSASLKWPPPYHHPWKMWRDIFLLLLFVSNKRFLKKITDLQRDYIQEHKKERTKLKM